MRPLCTARLLAMGINSNGTPREMRGDRREEEEEEARGEDETPMTSKFSSGSVWTRLMTPGLAKSAG